MLNRKKKAMKETYHVGQGVNEISLEVIIGTPGLAHTIVFLFSDSTTYEIIKESDADSGNIEKTLIGMTDGLAGNFLQIRSTVDFGTIDPEQWPQLADTIYCEYQLTGGSNGEGIFHCATDDKAISNNGRVVVIDKFIDLIQ